MKVKVGVALKKGSKNVGLMIVIIFLGFILGNFFGDFLGERFQNVGLLKQKYAIGTTTPFVLDLKVLILTLGLKINLNLMSIIGIIMSIILYRKYWE